MGLLVRISATIGIQGYVSILGGTDAGLNREIVETSQGSCRWQLADSQTVVRASEQRKGSGSCWQPAAGLEYENESGGK